MQAATCAAPSVGASLFGKIVAISREVSFNESPPMWTRIPDILIRRVLRPPLRIVFELILAQFAVWLFGKLREFFGHWQFQEERAARTAKQREAIRKKYELREADLAKIEKEIPGKIQEIVRRALSEVEKQTPPLAGAAEESFTVRRRKRKVRLIAAANR